MKRQKPDHALLARVDSRMITREIENAMEDVNHFSTWQAQIEHFRKQADALPDQRRNIVEEQHDENGKLIKSTSKAGQRAILDWAINDAEKAAEAGDIGKYGLHVANIVTALCNAALPAVEKSFESARQSRRGKAPKPHGTLLKIIAIIDAKTPDDAEQAFKDGATLEIDGRQVTLTYHPGEDKPYCANGETWSKGNLSTTITRYRKSK